MTYIRKFEDNLPLENIVDIFLSAFISIPNVIISAYAKPQLAATGDWGCSSNTDQTVKNINNHGAPTTLGLGDNSYERTLRHAGITKSSL